jgi:hypothetical protein
MKEYIREKLTGTWKLQSWVYTNERGEIVNYFGDHPSGILMYDAHGYMNAQLTRADRKPFGSPAINGGTADETLEAFHSYIAYFGTYSEQAPGEVVHHVHGSLFPNWVNRNELRYATIEGDKLTLSTPPVPVAGGQIVFTLTWRKVNHTGH